MKKTTLIAILSILLCVKSYGQCEIMKVEIKDSTVLLALRGYVAKGFMDGKLTKEKGIGLLSFNQLENGACRLGVVIISEDIYKMRNRLYLNYTVIDGAIFLIEHTSFNGKLSASEVTWNCIDKIVGNKLKPYPKTVKRERILPNGDKVIPMDVPKYDYQMDGAFYFDGKGNFQFKHAL